MAIAVTTERYAELERILKSPEGVKAVAFLTAIERKAGNVLSGAGAPWWRAAEAADWAKDHGAKGPDYDAVSRVADELRRIGDTLRKICDAGIRAAGEE